MPAAQNRPTTARDCARSRTGLFWAAIAGYSARMPLNPIPPAATSTSAAAGDAPTSAVSAVAAPVIANPATATRRAPSFARIAPKG